MVDFHGSTPRNARTGGHIRCAWIGESQVALSTARALRLVPECQLVVAAESGAISAQLLEQHPGIRIESHWEALLERTDLDLVIVGGGSDVVLEGARQLVRQGVVAIVDLSAASPTRLFSELTLIDAEYPQQVFPLFGSRASKWMQQLVRVVLSQQLGSLQSVNWERMVPASSVPAGEEISPLFLDDVDRLRLLCRAYVDRLSGRNAIGQDVGGLAAHDERMPATGRFEHATAFVHATENSAAYQARTTFGGTGLPPVNWSLTAGNEQRLIITLTGTSGIATLTQTSTETRLQVGDVVEVFRSSETERELELSLLIKESLSARFNIQAKQEPVASSDAPCQLILPTWDDLVRGLELESAVRQSLKRRRTIDILFEAPSERNLFKSHMTAAGCSLLLATPVGMVVYLLVAAAIPMPNWLKTILVALVFLPLGIFLAMQALVVITRPASSE